MNDTTSPSGGSGTEHPRDFVRDIVARHVEEGRYPQILTRFPPEPNGYPTIGHAKSMCLNFGIAEEFGGTYNLRFDDTNPETEEMQYVEAFIRDIKWLGFITPIGGSCFLIAWLTLGFNYLLQKDG